MFVCFTNTCLKRHIAVK